MIVRFDEWKNKYELSVTGIINVGAHWGQEYNFYKENFVNKIKTHWFDPNPESFSILKEKIGDYENVNLYNYGLGSEDTTLELNVDIGNDGQSSSFLNRIEHINKFTHIKFESNKKIKSKIFKLDNFNIIDSNLLVLNTQGFELEVLKGSTETLSRIDYIISDFNTIEMYENCPSISELDDFLIKFGFERKETYTTNDSWGDAFWIKNDKLSINDYSQDGEQKIILEYFNKINLEKLKFLDIGANDGKSFSNTYALSKLGWSGICLEPSHSAFIKLKETYSKNEKIKTFNVGISNQTNKLKFYESRNWVNSEAPTAVLSTLDPNHKNNFFGMNWEETYCDFFKWIDFRDKFNIDDNFDFISIDCEGHDYIVLEEIKELLKKSQLICLEHTHGDYKKFENILSEYDFELMCKTNDNSIFRKKNKTIVIIDCYVSNFEVENKLIDQIKKIKEIGLDILIISNTIIKNDIISLVDYHIYDKRNQLFEKEYQNIKPVLFTETITNGDSPPFIETEIITEGLQRHGLSVLINLYNSVNFVKLIGYKNFIRIEVDDLFGDKSLNFIYKSTFMLRKENKKALLYYNHYNSEPSNISFHFMNFDVDYFLEKIPQIKNENDYQEYLLENYENLNFEIAEEFIYNNLKKSGDDDVFIKDGNKMSIDFPDTIWNTTTSTSNISSKFENCITSLFEVYNSNEVMIFAFNKSNDIKKRKIKVILRNNEILLDYNLEGFNTWSYNLFNKKELIEIWVYEEERLLFVEKNQNITNKIKFL